MRKFIAAIAAAAFLIGAIAAGSAVARVTAGSDMHFHGSGEMHYHG